MEYTEYMETLKEQIQNKRARSLVAEEIRGHIEEQAKEYQAEGMSKEDAEREAVRQMGDPVETGCALNRIHRPAFPWKLFVLAVFLTGASMLISLTIDAKINEGGVQAAQVGSLLVVNAVSFAMIFVIMYFDYTWLFLHIRAVYALYMICLCLVWSGGLLGNYQTALLASYSVQVLHCHDGKGQLCQIITAHILDIGIADHVDGRVRAVAPEALATADCNFLHSIASL